MRNLQNPGRKVAHVQVSAMFASRNLETMSSIIIHESDKTYLHTDTHVQYQKTSVEMK